MNTRSAPELPAPKVNRQSLYLGAGLIASIIACVILLVWPRAQAATQATAIADRQRSKLMELEQARARWKARTFDTYRLHIQLGALDSPYCEKVFEVHEPGQTNMVSDTCAGRYDPELLRFLGNSGSVSGLFNYIDREISRVGECGAGNCPCHGALTIDVVYDTHDGYPKSVEERFEMGWPIKEWHWGACTAIWVRPPSPFKVSVNPIE